MTIVASLFMLAYVLSSSGKFMICLNLFFFEGETSLNNSVNKWNFTECCVSAVEALSRYSAELNSSSLSGLKFPSSIAC